jgi:hypothetical protein
METQIFLGWWTTLYHTRFKKTRKKGELFLMPFIAWRKNKEGDWQTEYWYMDNMDGGEQREKDLAQDLEEQGCMIEWQDV